MKRYSLAPFGPAMILFAGCALLLRTHFHPAVPLRGPLEGIMPQVAGFRVENAVIDNEERQVARMTDYIARVFWRDSVWAASIFVAYYDRQTQGRTIHSPRNCLPGAGWEVVSGGTRDVAAGDGSHSVNRYVLKNGQSMAVVYYWYQGRGRVVANEYAVKWNLLRDAALKGNTEEALVRVVVPVNPQGGISAGRTSAQLTQIADSIGANIAGRLISEVTNALPADGARQLGIAVPGAERVGSSSIAAASLPTSSRKPAP